MTLWTKHQRDFKSFICLHVVLKIILPWSMSHKICSIKVTTLLVWIPITWWFLRTSETIPNLLLAENKYVQIKWSSLCGITKTQRHLPIPNWCLVWNQTLKKFFEWEATFWKIHNMYIQRTEKEKESFARWLSFYQHV